MAIYGRSREKWDPTKIKSKVSKNLTYSLESASGNFFFWLDPENISNAVLGGPQSLLEDNTGALYVGNVALDVEGSPSLVENRASRFGAKSIYFPHGSPNYVYDGAGTGFSSIALAGPNRGYDTYISFWVNISQMNYSSSGGHCLGGFYRDLPATINSEVLSDLNPAILFNISSSGSPEIRFQKDGTTDKAFFQVSSAETAIEENKWKQITYVITDIPNTTAGTLANLMQIYVNGERKALGAPTIDPNFQFNGFDTGKLEILLGNSTFGYEDLGSSSTGDGFFGHLGDFIVFSQPTTSNQSQKDKMAKFVYEAQTRGAYHLHSGIHSSSPRLEQLDLDRDSLYPPNFTLENYTQTGTGWYSATHQSEPRTSSKSRSRFHEGYEPTDPWVEKASQRFVQSKHEYDSVNEVWEETMTVMPHLRLDPSDTLLTDGDWYSDNRSEFFSEDLDPSDGFVVSSTTAGNATPRTDDELYREHHSSDSVQKYVEIDVPEEYKDCFVIDIPLPNSDALILGTDRQPVHSSAAEISRIHPNGTIVQSPNGRISQMAYYNFAEGKWDLKTFGPGTSDNDYGLTTSEPDSTTQIDQTGLAFTPMTGLIVPNKESAAEKVLPMHGAPTSDYGFPFAPGYGASAGQSIDISKYIDEPVILEGWEIKTSVVPVVGYPSYTSTNQDSDFGFSVGSGKSPFHYGGHGESAVFFDNSKHLTGYNRNVIDISGDEWHVGNTVPITTENLDNEVVQPTKETEGLVTSGITAFLLKNSKVKDGNAMKEAYISLLRKDKFISKFTNIYTSIHSPPQIRDSSWGSAITPNSEDLNEFSRYNLPNTGFPTYLSDPSTDWSLAENNQLVGWLQHVFHNDPNAESLRTVSNHWVREDDTSISYNPTEGKNVIAMLDKENASYVPNLMYANTDEYSLHVKGNTKAPGKIVDGIPITNFFIAPFEKNIQNNLLLTTTGTQPSTVTIDNTTSNYAGPPEIYEGTTNWELLQLDSNLANGMGIPSPTTLANERVWKWESDTTSHPYNEGTIYIDVSEEIGDSETSLSLVFQIFLQNIQLAGAGSEYIEIRLCDADGNLLSGYQTDNWKWVLQSSQAGGWNTLNGPLHNAWLISPTAIGSQTIDGNLSQNAVHWIQINFTPQNSSPLDFSLVKKIKIYCYGLQKNGEKILIGNLSMSTTRGESENLGIYKSSGDMSSKYAMSTMSEGSTQIGDGGLSEASIIPRYGSSNSIGTTRLPRINIPSEKVREVDSVDDFHKEVSILEKTYDDAIVVLNPTDKLVLGIQNSISTSFASQQINAAYDKFIRWGRTSLTIPAQNNTNSSPYLRLYVKKTRLDKDFNIVADSSNYNANVNRDLGDHANADQFITSNASIYSGSMADDIMGPTYFTPPSHSISVPASVASGIGNNQVLESGTSDLIGALVQFLRDSQNGGFGYLRGGGLAGNTLPENGGSYDPATGTIAIPAEDRPDWYAVASWAYDPWDSSTGARTGSPSWANLNNVQQGTKGHMQYLLMNYTQAEIDQAISDWLNYDKRLANNAIPYSGTKWQYLGHSNLTDLGIPLQNVSVSWTQLSTQPFSYGGPLPAALHRNAFDSIVPMETLFGFVTRYHYDLQDPSATVAIKDASILFSGPWLNHVPGSSGGLFDTWRPEGGWLLEELNPNAGAPAVTLIDPLRRRPVTMCGAISAWYCKFKIPYFEGNVLSKVVGALTLEFRFIKIDAGTESGGAIRRPRYSNGTLLQTGDCFFFNSSNETVKLNLAEDLETPSSLEVFQPITTVYIVAGEGTPTTGNLFDLDLDDTLAGKQEIKLQSIDHSTLDASITWDELWGKIRIVLRNQKVHNPALLYDVIDGTGPEVFKGFTLKFPNDPRVQEVFAANATTINQEVEFEICGHDMTGVTSSNIADRFPSSPEEIYGVAQQQVTAGWDAAPVEPPPNPSPSSYGFCDGVNNNWYDEGGRMFNTQGVEVLPPSGLGSDTTPIGNFYNHWFSRISSEYYFCGDKTAFGDPNANLGDAKKWKITYSTIRDTDTRYETTSPTYSGEISKIIDRKVLFRTSVKDTTVKQTIQNPLLIGKAGPFGSLKRIRTLVDVSRNYWDSKMPLVDIPEGIDLTSFDGVKYSTNGEVMGWLLEDNDKKDSKQLSVSKVKAKFDNNDPAQYDTTNTSTIDFSYLSETDYTVQFPPVTTIDGVIYDHLQVTNTFQRDFRGTRDFSRYTLRNIAFTFGNGPCGRHKIRPSISIWGGFNTVDLQADMNWPDELILDPPRGARFGLMLYDESPRYVFSSTSYGQLRDMYEQSLDGKMDNFASDQKIFGSPVVINAINPTNPEAPKLMENSSRYNKTENATIVKPYIEENYEAITNPPNLKSETLRVDVAGSIRTRSALAPGNVASNIRRRG